MKAKHWVLLVILVAATSFIAYQQHTAPYIKTQGKIFGTWYTITYQSDSNLDKEILHALQSVDNSLSMFNQKSTLSRINRGDTTITDRHIDYILPKAQRISQATDGAFDITVAPLINVWGFGFKHNSLPTPHQVDSIREFVGYQMISINDHRVNKQDSRTMIDLSAIAKGYGVDVVAELLNKAKVRNYMVEIGGEVSVKGYNDKGKAWRIGIANPQTANTTQQSYDHILSITDRTMATSGNYRNFHEINGVRYAHTIDPRTGYPVQHEVISATVLAPHCYEADAYATAFMVLGLEKSKQIVSSHNELDAYIIYIDKDGNKKSWNSMEH